MDKLDLTQPIVAVHRRSRAVRDVTVNFSSDNTIYLKDHLPSDWWTFQHDGTHVNTCCPWHLRNVIPANSPTPSNEELTQRMEISPELAQRMADHLRECAAVPRTRPTRDLGAQKRYDDLLAIVSDLPKPVDPIDPDRREADNICSAAGGLVWGDPGAREAVYIAIKRGRVLEADAFTLAAGGTT